MVWLTISCPATEIRRIYCRLLWLTDCPRIIWRGLFLMPPSKLTCRSSTRNIVLTVSVTLLFSHPWWQHCWYILTVLASVPGERSKNTARLIYPTKSSLLISIPTIALSVAFKEAVPWNPLALCWGRLLQWREFHKDSGRLCWIIDSRAERL